MLSVIKRNIAANMVGGIWTAFLNLLVIPIQVRILGIEAYGLLSLIASLQIIFNILDLGLSTTVTREVASDISKDYRNSQMLIRTINTGYWPVGLALGRGLFLSAEWIAHRWLDLKALSPEVAMLAVQTMAVAIALRWPVSMYSGVISGLQQMAALNLLRTSAATLRVGGGIIILLLWPSFLLFLLWQAVSALLEVGLYAITCLHLLPGMSFRPRISFDVLKRIWRFSLDINLISILAIIFTQTDRLIISKLVSVEALGYYSLAYNASFGLSVIQNFITSAVFPALASDYSFGRVSSLASRYEKATQILVYLLTLPAFALVFYGHDLLRLLVSFETAEQASRVLGLLALGFLLNASVSVCYTLAVATGHTRLPLAVNVAAFLLYLPGLYFLIIKLGILGAAMMWLLLNLYYLFTLLPLVQKRVMQASIAVWFTKNLLPFLLAGFLSLGLGWAVVRGLGAQNEIAIWSIYVMAAGIYTALGFMSLDFALRQDILHTFRKFITIPVSATNGSKK